MRFIDRFTRDEFSAKVWWPFTMVLLVLFVLTFPAEHRAVDARHRETAAVDAALSQRVIQPNLESVPASTAITGTLSDALTEEVHDEILVNDDRIKAIRIWSSSHVLEWSSLSNDDVGSDGALNNDDIDAATAAAGAPTWLTTHRTPTNEPGPATFYSYTAIGEQPLIASFEYRDGSLTSDVRASWLGYQIAIGLGLLLAFGLSLLSMREPLAEIGTGVPFYAGSVPENLTLMEVDRAVAIEQAGDRIKERTASLQHKLEASEAARLRAEGRLQQALAALAQSGRQECDAGAAVDRCEVRRRQDPRAERRCTARVRRRGGRARQARSWATRPLVGRPEEAEDTEAGSEAEAGRGSGSEARSADARRASAGAGAGRRSARARAAEAGRRNTAARAGTHRASARARPDRSAARPDHHAGARPRAGREGRAER